MFTINDTRTADWRDWALYEEINCLYYSEYDMVASSYHELKGVDLEAYLYYVLLDFKYIQTKHIPENLRVKAIVWPKVTICHRLSLC
jgi:hypothetical protein